MDIQCQCCGPTRDPVILATVMKSIHPQTGFVRQLENLSLPAISKELPLSHGKNVTINTLVRGGYNPSAQYSEQNDHSVSDRELDWNYLLCIQHSPIGRGQSQFQDIFRVLQKTQLSIYPIRSSLFTSVCFRFKKAQIPALGFYNRLFLKQRCQKVSELYSLPQHRGDSLFLELLHLIWAHIPHYGTL